MNEPDPLHRRRTAAQRSVALLTAVLCSAAALTSSCTRGVDTTTNPAGISTTQDAATTQDSATQDTGRDAAGAVVKITSNGCDGQRQGSGAITTEDGRTVIYTAAHVIGANTDITANGEPVHVDGFIEDRDLAVLTGPETAGPDGSAADATTLEPGGNRVIHVDDRVTVLGYPNGTATGVTTTVSELAVRAAADGTLLNTITIDTEALAGLSGGAVLDTDGHLIATIVTRDRVDGRGVALPISDYSRAREPQPHCSPE